MSENFEDDFDWNMPDIELPGMWEQADFIDNSPSGEIGNYNYVDLSKVPYYGPSNYDDQPKMPRYLTADHIPWADTPIYAQLKRDRNAGLFKELVRDLWEPVLIEQLEKEVDLFNHIMRDEGRVMLAAQAHRPSRWQRFRAWLNV